MQVLCYGLLEWLYGRLLSVENPGLGRSLDLRLSSFPSSRPILQFHNAYNRAPAAVHPGLSKRTLRGRHIYPGVGQHNAGCSKLYIILLLSLHDDVRVCVRFYSYMSGVGSCKFHSGCANYSATPQMGLGESHKMIKSMVVQCAPDRCG